MRIQSNQIICGIEASRLRYLLRKCCWGVNTHSAVHRLGITELQATKLIKRLVRERYLSSADKWGRHDLRVKARALAQANFMKPISRTRAAELVVQLLSRVAVINANEELVHYVDQVVVFGSYADCTSSDVGDIDLAIRLPPRPGVKDFIEASWQRGAQLGRTFTTQEEGMTFGEQEVRRLLKKRSPYLSFHPISDLSVARNQSVLFEAKIAEVKPYRAGEVLASSLLATA